MLSTPQTQIAPLCATAPTQQVTPILIPSPPPKTLFSLHTSKIHQSHRKTAMNAKALPPRHAPPLAHQPQPPSWFQNNQRPHLNHPPT